MADLASAVAKLKAAGINNVPNANQIASMPGLSAEEKQLLVVASQNGSLATILSPTTGTSMEQQLQALAGRGGGSVSASAVPQQAVQKRDVAPAPNPNAAADTPTGLFGGAQPSNPIVLPTQEQEDAAAADYQKRLDYSNPYKGRPAVPVAMAPAAPIIPPVKNDTYIKPREALTPPPPYNGNTGEHDAADSNTRANDAAVDTGFSIWDKITGGLGGLGDILGGVVDAVKNIQPTLEAPDVYTPGAAPAMPDYSGVKTPAGIDFTFKRNPFTKEGKAMAKDVYAPEYETLDRLRESANNQYGRSDEVIKQLYKGLADDVLNSTKTRDKEYDTEITNTTDSGADAAAAVAQGYDSGSKIMAQVMAGLGDRTSKIDPNSLQAMAQERGGDMADMTQDAQQTADSLREGKTIQNDYTTDLGKAYQTQGAVSREGLIGQLNDVLGTYGNQELDLNSQERNSALALASQLSDWDWGSQQANYQTLQDQQANAWNQANWDRSNISDAYGNQWNQYQFGEQGRQAASQQEWDAYNQAVQNQLEAQKLAADNAAAAAKAGAGADPLDPSKYGEGVGAATASLSNYVTQFMPNAGYTGDDIQQALQGAAGFLSPRIQQYTGMTGGQQKYIDDLMASQPNLSPAKKQLLRLAADQYWMMNQKSDRALPTG